MTNEMQTWEPTPIKARDSLPSWFGQTIAISGKVVDEVRLAVDDDMLYLVGDCEGHLVVSVTLPIEYLDHVKEWLEDAGFEHSSTKRVESPLTVDTSDRLRSPFKTVDCLVYTQPHRFWGQPLEAYLFAAAHADKLAELLTDDRRYDLTRGASTMVHGREVLQPWGLVARLYRQMDIAAANPGSVDPRKILQRLWSETDLFIRPWFKISQVVDKVYQLWLSNQPPTGG